MRATTTVTEAQQPGRGQNLSNFNRQRVRVRDFVKPDTELARLMSAAAAACTRLKTDLPQTIFGCCAGQSNNPLTADSQADTSASLSTISIISIHHHHQQQQRRHQEAIHCCSPRHATNRTAYTRDGTNSLHYRRLQIQPVARRRHQSHP